jgi:hypothetical protein
LMFERGSVKSSRDGCLTEKPRFGARARDVQKLNRISVA